MAILKLYFSQTMLILAFTCLFWLASSMPASQTVNVCLGDCLRDAQQMLSVIQEACPKNYTEAKHNGFCLSALFQANLEPELNPNTQTTAVCRPKGCPGDTRSEFNEELCRHNVGQDLVYYRNVLSAVVSSDSGTNELRTALGTSLLESVQCVLESCKPWPLSEELPIKTAVVTPTNSFEERKTLTRMLRGFEVRAITINRALGHIHRPSE